MFYLINGASFDQILYETHIVNHIIMGFHTGFNFWSLISLSHELVHIVTRGAFLKGFLNSIS